MSHNSRKNSNASSNAPDLCKAVSDLFDHARKNGSSNGSSNGSNSNYRSKPCVNGENCKYINEKTGEDKCIFANTPDKLNPVLCGYDESCKYYATCKRFHPKRGQTMEEYIEVNGFVFPKKSPSEKVEEKVDPILENIIVETAPVEEKSTWTVVDHNGHNDHNDHNKDQYIIRIEESDDEEEEESANITNIDEMVEMCKTEFMSQFDDSNVSNSNLSVHEFIERLVTFMLDFVRIHNLSGDAETQFKNRIRESGLYAEYQQRLDDMAMEEVCDELDIIVHQQEFAEEVNRILEEDPHVTEFDEFQEQVEFTHFFREMQEYAWTVYGIPSY